VNLLAWIAKAAAALATVIITLVSILFLLMRWERGTDITLPAPTGPFAVGRTTYAWTNKAATGEPALLVWVWYPAARSETALPTEYLPAPWRAALAQHESLLMRSFLKHDPALVRVHSVSGAPVSSAQSTYPVVLLRAGGSALTTDFTTLAEDLASHGFFVVGFDAPYRTFVVVLPDGRVIARSPANNVENASGNLADPVITRLLAMWTSDTAFVVDQLQGLNADPSQQFAGRLDLQHLGMFGHSFGGATALEFCHVDSRCRAALDIDGIPFGSVVMEGLGKPGMFLLSDHSKEMADPESRAVLAEIQSIYDRLPAGRSFLVIRTANHFSFSDQILLNSQAVMHLLRLAGFGGLDGRRGLAISTSYVHAFFDVYLKGASASTLASLAGEYPEVQLKGE
jgi:hypothetical protein